ncbi:MAG: hypothetical protein WD059_11015 [Balneolaceae bacterium]
MENEQVQPSYWNSVMIASLITGLIVTILSLIGGYMTLGSEPAGSLFNSAQIFGIVGCLIGAVGGIIVNWHYAKEFDITYKIGKGALLGLFVGVGATIITVLLGQLWNIIDPGYAQAIVDWNIANFEAMQLPEEAKQQSIESMGDPHSLKTIGVNALFLFISLGIINVISGMVGAKIFASEE